MSTPAESGPTRGVIGLLVSLVGASLMTWSFFAGIGTALNGGGLGVIGYGAAFILGGGLVVAAIVFAIVHLMRGDSPLLAVLTIVASLLPLAVVAGIALVSNVPG